MKLTDKKIFKRFIHINYITGFLYAFYFYFTSPKATSMLERRLWAYECWLILSLYGIFLWLFAVSERKNPPPIITDTKRKSLLSIAIFMIVFFTFFLISKIA